MSRVGRSFGGLMTLAVALAPAVMPVAGALAAVAGGAVAMGATGGAGLGIFGAAMMGAVKQTQTMKASTGQLSDNLKMQEQILSQLSPGTKAYNTQLKAVATAQDRYNHALADTMPHHRRFLSAMDEMKNSWTSFINQTSPGTLGVASTVLEGINGNMYKMIPIVNAVTPLIQDVATRFNAWLSNGGLDRFIAIILSQGIPAIKSIIQAVVDFTATMGFGLRTFADLGVSVAGALASGSAALRGWAAGGGFSTFLDMVRSNAPLVREFFTALGEVLKHVLIALNDLGPSVLYLVTILLQMVAALPVAAIQAFFYAFMGYRIIAIASALLAVFTGAMAACEAAALGTRLGLAALWIEQKALAVWGGIATAAQWAFNTSLYACPVVWIIAAILAIIAIIVIIITHLDFFKALWETVWNWTKEVAGAVWNWIVNAAQSFWNWLINIFDVSLNWILGIWNTVWDAVSNAVAIVFGVIATIWNDTLKPVFDGIVTVLKYIGIIIFTIMVTPWIIAWNILSTLVMQVWNGLLKPTFEAIGGVLVWLWEVVVQPTLQKIGDFFSWIFQVIVYAAQIWWASVTETFTIAIAVIEGIWNAVWTRVSDFVMMIWNGIVAFVVVWWADVQSRWETALMVVQAIWNTIWDAVSSKVIDIWNFIVAFAVAWWVDVQSRFQIALAALQLVWNTIWDAVSSKAVAIWNAIVEFATTYFWNPLKGFFQAGSDWILNTFWNPIKDFFTVTIPDAFKVGVDAIGRAWDAIKQVVRAPIQAVIDVVYNHGIVAVWNMVAGTFGVDKLGEYNLPQFAVGGPVSGPGNSTSDSVMARLSTGEHVWTANEVAAAGGHAAVQGLRSMVMGGKSVQGAVAGSMPGLSFGGWIGDALGAVGNAINSALDGLKNAALGAIYPFASKGIDAAANIGKDALRGLIPGSPPLEGMSVGMVDKMADTVKSWIKAKDVAPAPTSFGVAGVIPEGEHRNIIMSALAAAGVPPPGSLNEWLVGMNTLIVRESGWNASAMNNWDSNAAAGIPSGGLAQVIGPTFAANHAPGTSWNLLDPVANVAAAIIYITRRYGNITNVQQANANLPPRGYGLGTPGANAGWSWVGEHGPELVKFRGGEKVVNHDQSMQFMEGSRGDVNISMPITVQGNLDRAAVDKLEKEVVPRLRMMLQQKVGRNR